METNHVFTVDRRMVQRLDKINVILTIYSHDKTISVIGKEADPMTNFVTNKSIASSEWLWQLMTAGPAAMSFWSLNIRVNI